MHKLITAASMLMISAAAAAQTVGVNVATAHTSGGYRSDTYGLYVRSDDGFGAGILRNSLGRTSMHVSKTWDLARTAPIAYSATLGGITGYTVAPVIPLVALTARVGHHALHVLPNPRGASALTYSVEMAW